MKREHCVPGAKKKKKNVTRNFGLTRGIFPSTFRMLFDSRYNLTILFQTFSSLEFVREEFKSQQDSLFIYLFSFFQKSILDPI